MGPRIVRWYRWSVVYVFVCQVDQVTGLGVMSLLTSLFFGVKGNPPPDGHFRDDGSRFDPQRTVMFTAKCKASDLVNLTYRDMDQGPVKFSQL